MTLAYVIVDAIPTEPVNTFVVGALVNVIVAGCAVESSWAGAFEVVSGVGAVAIVLTFVLIAENTLANFVKIISTVHSELVDCGGVNLVFNKER